MISSTDTERGRRGDLMGPAFLQLAALLTVAARFLLMSHALGPSLYALAGLSTQLGLYFAFLDLGTILMMQKLLPQLDKDGLSTRGYLISVQRVLLLVQAMIVSVVVTIFVLSRESHSGLMFQAIALAAIMFPAQNFVSFRLAAYAALRMQIRGTRLQLMAGCISLALTALTLPLSQYAAIWIPPALGFLLALYIDGRAKLLPRLGLVMRFGTAYSETSFLRPRTAQLTILFSQMLAVAMMSMEALLAPWFLAPKDVGVYLFGLNMLPLLGIFPIILANELSPALNSGTRLESSSLSKIFHLGRRMLAEILAPLTSFLMIASSVAIEYVWTDYRPLYPGFYFVLLSVPLYFLTFATSTFFLSIEKQRLIAIIQMSSLLAQVLTLVILVNQGVGNIHALALSAMVKFLLYGFLHFVLMGRMVPGSLKLSVLFVLCRYIGTATCAVLLSLECWAAALALFAVDASMTGVRIKGRWLDWREQLKVVDSAPRN